MTFGDIFSEINLDSSIIYVIILLRWRYTTIAHLLLNFFSFWLCMEYLPQPTINQLTLLLRDLTTGTRNYANDKLVFMLIYIHILA